MSTITRHSGTAPIALPQVGSGDAIFAAAAVIIAILALIAKFAGIFE